MNARVTLVVITRDRKDELLATLADNLNNLNNQAAERLRVTPAPPPFPRGVANAAAPVTVRGNASRDGARRASAARRYVG